ncbi:hypothetical protein [Acinetobacter oleivorans]|uniref:Uncharacterized protein n=1 Tax=Acinetobacter oleivorans (strain JCM 16667 / KCTC 23045 / DR1) TaxID=436717 RepID=A0AAN0P7X7_ACISD|nr:hypothetical protein [Acinetobacter oleivorans]ADI90442.1 hypothetical protein AOLE_07755 [Acinetobacter oleivorans DR1]ESK45200.1 hypothetical protein P254_00811 [Acinetobacter oleivorans CIP 110421]
MQQAQDNVLVGIAEPINDQGENLLIDHFLGCANRELEPHEIDKVVNGEMVEGITAYKQGHYYKISSNNEKQNATDFEISIHFQDGPISEHGINGATSEALLQILIHRTKTLDENFPSEFNKQAIAYMESALEEFNKRTSERRARGVEGTLVK